MINLDYSEIILLNNLIYLEWDGDKNERFIDIIDKLLNRDYLNNLMKNMGECSIDIKITDWIRILINAKNKFNLCELKIIEVKNYDNGMRLASFEDNYNNLIVVFRGTTSQLEWEDNGKGSYECDTEQQIEALNYINSLNYDNVTVTGHSKGGNKAKYVSVLSSKVKKCISINGQGFSIEFITKYEKEIDRNLNKIISINAKYDYINCLFYEVSGEIHYIKTAIRLNPLDYHRADILLDSKGNLKEEVQCGIFPKIINEFSVSLISDLPKEIRSIAIDSVIGGIELVLCKNYNINETLIRIIGGIVIITAYTKYFQYKEMFTFIYTALEGLLIPLMFWNNFIEVEEKKSTELLNNLVYNITFLENKIINRLKKIDKIEKQSIDSIESSINKLINDIKEKIILI